MKTKQFNGIKSCHFPLNIAVMFSLLLIFLLTGESAFGLTVDRVLATVGGEIITFTEYKQFAKGSERENKDEVDEALLKKMMEEKIIIQEAKRKGFEASDIEVEKMVEEFKSQNGLSQEDLENFLKEEGLSINSYQQILKGKALLSKLVGSDVDSKVIIRDGEIQQSYRENKKEFLLSPQKVEVKAIFLKLREDASVTEITDLKLRALRITTLLKDGYNFDRLVNEYSDEPLRSQGGMLGKFTRGALISPLDSKAFSLKEGEISDPIWVSEGVYILQLAGKSGEIFRTFDEVKEEIYGTLYKQKRDKIYNEWIKALWEKSPITINQSQ